METNGKCRMNKPFIFSSLVFVAGFFGCRATPYQRLGTTLAGGYSEKVMSEDTFYIRFVANNHTSPKVVCRYLYRRAAEVTLRHGFLFFAVIRGPSPLTERIRFYASEDAYDDMDSPIEVDVPQGNRLKMVIQCFGEIPEPRDMRLINAKSYLEWKNSAYEKDY
ncbi:MAG: CC0125/CC1285 family lipoprotein [Planctomycetota bacterium]